MDELLKRLRAETPEPGVRVRVVQTPTLSDDEHLAGEEGTAIGMTDDEHYVYVVPDNPHLLDAGGITLDHVMYLVEDLEECL